MQSLGLSAGRIIATVLILNSRVLQFFFALAAVFLASNAVADLVEGRIYSLKFVDLDGNTLTTDDGHITMVVLTGRSDVDRARAVGDHSPDFCLGNPGYRMITVVSFRKRHSAPVRAVFSGIMRRRLDAEGKRLQQRYDQLQIGRAARSDVHAVADFDRKIAERLGLSNSDTLFCVLVFGKNGALLKQWNKVPDANELSSVLANAR
jgi:hypothetical protein